MVMGKEDWSQGDQSGANGSRPFGHEMMEGGGTRIGSDHCASCQA